MFSIGLRQFPVFRTFEALDHITTATLDGYEFIAWRTRSAMTWERTRMLAMFTFNLTIQFTLPTSLQLSLLASIFLIFFSKTHAHTHMSKDTITQAKKICVLYLHWYSFYFSCSFVLFPSL